MRPPSCGHRLKHLVVEGRPVDDGVETAGRVVWIIESVFWLITR